MERLSSALAAGWSMQRACAALVDGHMNGPGFARSPSWVGLGGVIEGWCYLESGARVCRYGST